MERLSCNNDKYSFYDKLCVFVCCLLLSIVEEQLIFLANKGKQIWIFLRRQLNATKVGTLCNCYPAGILKWKFFFPYLYFFISILFHFCRPAEELLKQVQTSTPVQMPRCCTRPWKGWVRALSLSNVAAMTPVDQWGFPGIPLCAVEQ